MDELIGEYGRGYTMLREAIEGLNDEELRFNPSPDKWSHSSNSNPCCGFRACSDSENGKVLAEEKPLLMSWDQDAWANGLRYEKLDREQHLLLFQLLRTNMQSILALTTVEQGERVGVYEDGGRFTFYQL